MYVTWDRETQSDTLVLYFMPTEGTANPCIWLPTQTLVDLGRSSYAPARMEQVEDVINMTRLRTRATPTQLHQFQYTRSQTRTVQEHRLADGQTMREGGGQLLQRLLNWQ